MQNKAYSEFFSEVSVLCWSLVMGRDPMIICIKRIIAAHATGTAALTNLKALQQLWTR